MSYTPEKGDTVLITREAVVDLVDKEAMLITDTNGHLTRYGFPSGVLAAGARGYTPLCQVKLVSRPKKMPYFWPPQSGDVWRNEETKEEYHVFEPKYGVYIGNETLRFVKANDDTVATRKNLENCKLVYRKGDQR